MSDQLAEIKRALNEPLKPCPFCGGENITLHKGKFLIEYQCDSCQACGGASTNEQIAYWAWQQRNVT